MADTKSNTPPSTPAKASATTKASAARDAEVSTVQLLSRYANLGVRDLVRFQAGRATVTDETFKILTDNPAFGFGTDFWVDTTSASAETATAGT